MGDKTLPAGLATLGEWKLNSSDGRAPLGIAEADDGSEPLAQGPSIPSRPAEMIKQ
jgi:hypothetical protein